MQITKTHKTAGGTLQYCTHESKSTGTPMTLSVFTPPGDGPFPILIWLSGLTCTEDNFTTKAGAYNAAAKHGLMIVAPDTSPRGEDVANDDNYDLGQGAGFYLDATQAPWAPHFKMESYITRDLLEVIRDNTQADLNRIGLSGHSMGGHGALTLALRHPSQFKSVSAFAPIAAPTQCPWGQKAFNAYLGDDKSQWTQHDACELIRSGAAQGHFDDILIDQGTADDFLDNQLMPQHFESACKDANQPLTLRMQEGYDHSYFFMASFIKDHIHWHSQRL